ncbi:transcriptional regulator family: Fungal Specific TF [Penicillium roqueforti]|nr:transcriptional regulator family: Fungal Specific TF [Penicillium roqueforti]
MADKLPIPRLPHRRREGGGRRISQACDTCRERKTKCDGHRPHCTQCVVQGLDNCFYSERKLVRLQGELGSERRKVKGYEELLQDLSVELEEPIADRIRKALKNPRAEDAKHGRRHSNASSSSSLGSLEDVDVTSEDHNRDEKSRATGYMGKNSEIVWMQRLDTEATRQSGDKSVAPENPLQGSPDDPISSMNYHLDDLNLANPVVSNPYILPPRGLSDRLFEIYLDKVQVSLPFLRRDLFCAQYQRCFLGGVNPGRKWLAALNLVFAIGAAYSRLSGENLSGVDENIFFARAKSLSASENILYEHDDLQQVQIESLMAFFFLVISQINRSWKMVAIAARSGISLGINLHNKHGGYDIDSEEARKQLWWSIFRLEHLLSVMTGRVSCIGSASSSLPPPLPLPNLAHAGFDGIDTDDETRSQLHNLHWTMQMDPKSTDMQSRLLKSLKQSPSLYHFYMVDLSCIAHAISSEVYVTDSYPTDWGSIESRISLYNKRMDCWVSRLNAAFHFQDRQGNLLPMIDSPFQISLALSYYSTRIVLNRPCLNRPTFDKESGVRLARSRFSNLSALACLQASLAIVTLLPDHSSLNWSYQLLQWWDLVHVLTQATIILLLDISIGPVPTKPGEAHVTSESIENVLNAAKKGILWLHCLGRTSGSAQRSFELVNRCIHHLTAARDFDMSDIPPLADGPITTRSPRGTRNLSSTQGSELQSEVESQEAKNFAPFGHTNSGTVTQAQPRRRLSVGAHQSILPLYDGDTDMPVSSQLADSEFEDLLLSMMAS